MCKAAQLFDYYNWLHTYIHDIVWEQLYMYIVEYNDLENNLRMYGFQK